MTSNTASTITAAAAAPRARDGDAGGGRRIARKIVPGLNVRAR
jgi:hypothetical protein